MNIDSNDWYNIDYLGDFVNDPDIDITGGLKSTTQEYWRLLDVESSSVLDRPSYNSKYCSQSNAIVRGQSWDDVDGYTIPSTVRNVSRFVEYAAGPFNTRRNVAWPTWQDLIDKNRCLNQCVDACYSSCDGCYASCYYTNTACSGCASGCTSGCTTSCTAACTTGCTSACTSACQTCTSCASCTTGCASSATS